MTASSHALQQSLETELDLVQRFMGILQNEASALAQPDHGEALETCTRQKNECIEQLIQAGQARESSLRELGYSTDRAGLEAASADHQLDETCATLLELGRQAGELNASNGVIIDTYLKHTQQAFQTMRQLIGGSDLYDASGKPDALKGRRTKITAG